MIPSDSLSVAFARTLGPIILKIVEHTANTITKTNLEMIWF